MLRKLVSLGQKTLSKAFPWLIGSVAILQKLIVNQPIALLDAGCGSGTKFKSLKEADRNEKLSHIYSVGLDTFKAYLVEAKEIYSDVIRCDVRWLPVKKKSVDVVLCLDLIEHLEKHEGLKLLRDIETAARKQIIVYTPVGWLPQTGKIDGNLWQKHRSAWFPQEFTGKSFKTIGVNGLSYIYAKQGVWGDYKFKQWPLRLLLNIIKIVSQFITFHFVQLAYQMYCTKYLVE